MDKVENKLTVPSVVGCGRLDNYSCPTSIQWILVCCLRFLMWSTIVKFSLATTDRFRRLPANLQQPVLVANALNASSQNYVFDLPLELWPFPSASVVGNRVLVSGGTYTTTRGSSTIKQQLFVIFTVNSTPIVSSQLFYLNGVFQDSFNSNKGAVQDAKASAIYTLQTVGVPGKFRLLIEKIMSDNRIAWALTIAEYSVAASCPVLLADGNVVIFGSICPRESWCFRIVAKLAEGTGATIWRLAGPSVGGSYSDIIAASDRIWIAETAGYATLDVRFSSFFSNGTTAFSRILSTPFTEAYRCEMRMVSSSNGVTLAIQKRVFNDPNENFLGIVVISADGQVDAGYRVRVSASSSFSVQLLVVAGFTTEGDPIFGVKWADRGETVVACFSVALGQISWAYTIADSVANNDRGIGEAYSFSAVQLDTGAIFLSGIGSNELGHRYAVWSKIFFVGGDPPCDMVQVQPSSLTRLSVVTQTYTVDTGSPWTLSSTYPFSPVVLSSLAVDAISPRMRQYHCDATDETDDGPPSPPTYSPTSAPTLSATFQHTPKCPSSSLSAVITNVFDSSPVISLQSSCRSLSSFFGSTVAPAGLIVVGGSFQVPRAFGIVTFQGSVAMGYQTVASDRFTGLYPRAIALSDNVLYSLNRATSVQLSDQLVLIKSVNNQVQWAIQYSYTSEGNVVVPSGDGGVLVGGRICLPYEGGCQAHITKFDSNGVEQWSRLAMVFYNIQRQPSYASVFSMVEASDTGRIYSVYSMRQSIHSSDVVVQCMDGVNGNFRWAKKASVNSWNVPKLFLNGGELILEPGLNSNVGAFDYIRLDAESGEFIGGTRVFARSDSYVTNCQLGNPENISCWTPVSAGGGFLEVYSLSSGDRIFRRGINLGNAQLGVYPIIIRQSDNHSFLLMYSDTSNSKLVVSRIDAAVTDNSSVWIKDVYRDPMSSAPMTSSDYPLSAYSYVFSLYPPVGYQMFAQNAFRMDVLPLQSSGVQYTPPSTSGGDTEQKSGSGSSASPFLGFLSILIICGCIAGKGSRSNNNHIVPVGNGDDGEIEVPHRPKSPPPDNNFYNSAEADRERDKQEAREKWAAAERNADALAQWGGDDYDAARQRLSEARTAAQAQSVYYH